MLAARLEPGSVGMKSPGPVPSGATSARSARLVSNEAFRCIRAASSPADSGPWKFWWTQGVSEARPPACRAGALPLSYVSVVVMGGFDPPPRAFQARALPTELHDHGAGPGTRTRIAWDTKPVPIPLGPTGTSRAAVITPRRLGAVLHRRPRRAAAALKNPTTVQRTTPTSRRSLSRCRRERRASADRVASGHLLSNDSGGRCRTLISRTKTLRPAIGRLPKVGDGRVNGYRPHYSWVEATRVSVNTLTPWSSRRVLTPRPPRWQRDALPLSYYCDGGTGWILTSVARVAIGYLNPRPRCQGCGGGHRTPDDGG